MCQKWAWPAGGAEGRTEMVGAREDLVAALPVTAKLLLERRAEGAAGRRGPRVGRRAGGRGEGQLGVGEGREQMAVRIGFVVGVVELAGDGTSSSAALLGWFGVGGISLGGAGLRLGEWGRRKGWGDLWGGWKSLVHEASVARMPVGLACPCQRRSRFHGQTHHSLGHRHHQSLDLIPACVCERPAQIPATVLLIPHSSHQSHRPQP